VSVNSASTDTINQTHSLRQLTAGSLKLTVGAFSSAGAKLKNEDAFSTLSPKTSTALTKGIVTLVADGVSHSVAPAKASQYCAQQFVEQYSSCPASWSTQHAIAQILTQINNFLFFGAEKSNQPLNANQSQQWLTTTSGVIFKSNTAHIFHVGDSQILRIRDGQVAVLTQAHNQKLANNTRLLTRAMGADNQLKVDFKTVSIQTNDIFVLTTDGVHEHINFQVLIDWINQKTDLAKLSKKTALLAAQNGSLDNLTCLVVKINEVPLPQLTELQHQLFAKKIPPALSAGQIIDRYQVLKVLHATARSHLYLVKSQKSDKTYALKAPSQNFEDDEIYLQGFIREAWVGTQVIDAKIMRIYSASPDSPFLYHLCEYIEGQTLRQWMLDHPNPKLDQVRKIITQIASALRLLKRLEIIHRDLKPENLMITTDGQVKLIDFGAVSIAALEENINNISESVPLGTLNYVAPETLTSLVYTHQSDLFALGIIAYEMLTGKFPYSAPTKSRLKNHASYKWRYQSARDVRADLPFWLDLALQKAVEPDPDHRYEAYSQFITEITRPNIQAEKTYLSRPLIQRDPVKFWQTLSGLLAVTVVGLVVKLATL